MSEMIRCDQLGLVSSHYYRPLAEQTDSCLVGGVAAAPVSQLTACIIYLDIKLSALPCC